MSQPAGIALIYIPPGVDFRVTFGGRTLLDRSRALARAAGLEPIVVDGRSPGAELPAGPRPGDALAAGPGPVVLLRCDVACVAGAVRDLLRSATALALRDDLGRVALVRRSVVDLGGAIPRSLDDAAQGIDLAPRPGWLGARRIQALGYAAAHRPASELAPERAAAERAFLRALENPRDGFLDGVLNRHLSRPLSRVLLALPVTPNQITVAGLVLSLVAAALIALPGIAFPVLGALLLQATAVLDCVDGEIARAKVLESEWGEWLDITSDTLIHVATFLGIAVHAWPALGRETAWLLGALFTVGGLASFVVVTRAEKTEERWKGAPGWPARLLGLLLATLTTRDLSALVLVAAAADLLTPLLIGAAFGAQAFWIGTLALHTSVMRRLA